MAFDIDKALRYVVEHEGSDLHVKVPARPMVRVHGVLQPIPLAVELTPEDTDGALKKILTDPALLANFAEVGEADFSYEVPGASRFRVNAFRQRGHVSIVCRAIPFQVRTIEDLELPPVIRDLADQQRGIILLTGTTGSGKSTTLAAMIDRINSTQAEHIVTLEDPIEYLHRDKKSIINQREVGQDTESFGRAMKRVLRQDPDVILIGEMRDEETVRTALSAAETGHLVLSTLHTLDATETINRIIDFFPPHLQGQARVMLASTLRGVVGQRLMPRMGGHGRVAVCEVLVVTGRVQDLILNPNETGKITEVIAEGEYYGMQTFDQALLKHVMAGNIAEEDAMKGASSPHDFKLMLQAGGQRASGIEQVMGNGGATAEDPRPYDSSPTETPHRPVGELLGQ
ncbi:MAG TPA: type IV pilus twitching motility protein PilT [Solirubrobacterales bacterium]|nr:type IV pilus twitching motility protein PilT [Solirubrobacterales bacterium]